MTRTRGLLALVVVGYLYASPYSAALNNPNENVRHYMTAAIVDEGTVEISALRARWGWVNDAACVERHAAGADAPRAMQRPCEGRRTPAGWTRHYYSVKAPLTSLLALPGYALHRAISGDAMDRHTSLYVCRLFSSVLPLLAFFVYFAAALEREGLSPPVRDATLVSLAFGSVFYGYGLAMLSHSLAGASAFVAWDLLRRARLETTRAWRAALAGFLAAAVTGFEYPGFFLSLTLSLYAPFALRRPRLVAAFALGALVPTLTVIGYHVAAFDQLGPGHLYVETAAFRAIHEDGFFGADGFHPEAAMGLLFGLRTGLFPFSPAFALGVLGALALPFVGRASHSAPTETSAGAERRAHGVALAGILSSFLLICLMQNWDGGWVIGPRYLVWILPQLAFTAGAFVERFADRRRLLVGGYLGLVAAGVLLSALPSVYFPHLPPEFGRAIPELIVPLVGAGYAPHSVATAMGVMGVVGIAPLFAIWAAATVASGRGLGAPAIAAALLVATVGAAFAFAPAEETPEVERARAYVERVFEPRPPED